jgi:hypothetical protein
VTRSPPPDENTNPRRYQAHAVLDRILDHAADILIAVRGIATELDNWNARPVRGRIFINGVESVMTSPTTPTDIPDDDTTATVQWEDRFQQAEPGADITTQWEVVDENGQPSQAVSVNAEANDEDADVVFNQGQGLFQIRATGTKGGITAQAESALYNIKPGALAVGQIVLNPVQNQPATPTGGP